MTARDNNKLIIQLKQTWVWAVCVLLALASCRKDDSEDMTGRVTLYPAIANREETVINTRAAFPVQNTTNTYTDDAFASGTNIRVYALSTNDAGTAFVDDKKAVGSFRYSNNSWHTSVNALSNYYYHLYAYSPANLPGASDIVFNWGTKDNTFSLDNTAITFTDLNLLTDTDPIVSVAANGKLVTEAESYTAPTLTSGNFDIHQVTEEVGKTYKVWMAMDHLYAKATVSMCIDPKYHELRDIRVKNVWITTDKGTLKGSHSYTFKTLKLNLDETQGFPTDNEYSIDLMYGTTAKENRDDPLDPTCTWATLKEPAQDGSYTEFGWFCFLPISYLSAAAAVYPDVYIKIEYDVYDRNGIAVRLNREVKDHFPLNSIRRSDNALVVPKAGDHFKIKVLIKPTYLYQMHDDDEPLGMEITGIQTE